jgi:hypothetical protein
MTLHRRKEYRARFTHRLPVLASLSAARLERFTSADRPVANVNDT